MQNHSVKYLQSKFNNPLKDYSPWSPLVQSQGAKSDIPKLIREMHHLNRPGQKARGGLDGYSKGQ